MSSSTISARLDNKTYKKLEKLANATNRSKSFLAAEAIQKYIDEQSWQIDAIKTGIKESDKRNFADDKDIKNFLLKWEINAD